MTLLDVHDISTVQEVFSSGHAVPATIRGLSPEVGTVTRRCCCTYHSSAVASALLYAVAYQSIISTLKKTFSQAWASSSQWTSSSFQARLNQQTPSQFSSDHSDEVRSHSRRHLPLALTMATALGLDPHLAFIEVWGLCHFLHHVRPFICC